MPDPVKPTQPAPAAQAPVRNGDPIPTPASTAHKATWSAISAVLSVVVIGTAYEAAPDLSTLGDWLACKVFGSTCPSPDIVAAAAKQLVHVAANQVWQALITGGVVHQTAYWKQNYLK